MFLDRGRFLSGKDLDPLPGLVDLTAVRHQLQHIVEQRIAGRRPILDHEVPQIGFDAAGERKLQHRGARHCKFEGVLADGKKNALVLVEEE